MGDLTESCSCLALIPTQVVDKSRGEKLVVNMNITFPRVPCYRKLGRATYEENLLRAMRRTGEFLSPDPSGRNENEWQREWARGCLETLALTSTNPLPHHSAQRGHHGHLG